MALLCKNFKPESQVVWIWEAFLHLCNLVVDIVYATRSIAQLNNCTYSKYRVIQT